MEFTSSGLCFIKCPKILLKYPANTGFLLASVYTNDNRFPSSNSPWICTCSNFSFLNFSLSSSYCSSLYNSISSSSSSSGGVTETLGSLSSPPGVYFSSSGFDSFSSISLFSSSRSWRPRSSSSSSGSGRSTVISLSFGKNSFSID
jgi:hypothetical protein